MQNVPEPELPGETRFPALDGLRGLAIVGVLFNHLGPRTAAPDQWWLLPITWISNIGWIGVDLFFVLSGFLITGILVKNRKATNYYATFYIHRALRIFPLLYLLLLITTVILPASGWTLGAYLPGRYWPHWLFMSDLWIFSGIGMSWITIISPVWSLAVEEKFYVIWSIVVRHSQRLAAIAVGALLAGVALRCYLLYITPRAYISFVFFFSGSHLDGLCIGVLSRLLFDGLPQAALKAARSWPLWLALLICILGTDALIAPELSNSYRPVMMTAGFPVISALSASLILHGLMIDGWVRAAFNAEVWKRVGRYSYCIYLWHMPIAALLGPSLVIEVPATLLFAHGSYVFFEAPLLRLKTRWRYDD